MAAPHSNYDDLAEVTGIPDMTFLQPRPAPSPPARVRNIPRPALPFSNLRNCLSRPFKLLYKGNVNHNKAFVVLGARPRPQQTKTRPNGVRSQAQVASNILLEGSFEDPTATKPSPLLQQGEKKVDGEAYAWWSESPALATINHKSSSSIPTGMVERNLEESCAWWATPSTIEDASTLVDQEEEKTAEEDCASWADNPTITPDSSTPNRTKQGAKEVEERTWWTFSPSTDELIPTEKEQTTQSERKGWWADSLATNHPRSGPACETEQSSTHIRWTEPLVDDVSTAPLGAGRFASTSTSTYLGLGMPEPACGSIAGRNDLDQDRYWVGRMEDVVRELEATVPRFDGEWDIFPLMMEKKESVVWMID